MSITVSSHKNCMVADVMELIGMEKALEETSQSRDIIYRKWEWICI